MFKGSIPAVITPFDGNDVDYDSFAKVLNYLIDNGSNGIVPCGTTGESPTLSHEEHKKIIEEAIRVSDKRVPVIAGTGSNNTLEAIEYTKHAESSGADAALVVTPYYNKPTQSGLYEHFKKIADMSNIPIIIYNIPGRSIALLPINTASPNGLKPRTPLCGFLSAQTASVFGGGVCSKSAWMTGAPPSPLLAITSGVLPNMSPCSMSAFPARSALITGTLPSWQANISGVQPAGESVTSGLALAASSTSMTAARRSAPTYG